MSAPTPPAPAPGPAPGLALGPAHQRRLREVWRSAGWPYRDAIEAELLAAGWLLRRLDGSGRETVHVTDAGVQVLAAVLQRNRARLDAHEALVARVVSALQRDGRIAWRRLTLRAPLDGAWVLARPDVFSVRHTTLEGRLEPTVHEIKVRRSDLLADLRRDAKGRAYAALASRCWYVLAAGIAVPDEVPPAYGVMLAHADGLEPVRSAPARPCVPGLATWMALARATPEPHDDGAQAPLDVAEAVGGDAGGGEPGPLSAR